MLVDFPLERLDLTDYVLKPGSSSSIYSLYAVTVRLKQFHFNVLECPNMCRTTLVGLVGAITPPTASPSLTGSGTSSTTPMSPMYEIVK